jgi:hypothetical protein
MPREFYAVAHMCLKVNRAAGDLENLARAVFDDRIVAIRSTQASFNVGWVRVAAGGGSLRKPERDQQGRYKHH